jgi:hypothetical protein
MPVLVPAMGHVFNTILQSGSGGFPSAKSHTLRVTLRKRASPRWARGLNAQLYAGMLVLRGPKRVIHSSVIALTGDVRAYRIYRTMLSRQSNAR